MVKMLIISLLWASCLSFAAYAFLIVVVCLIFVAFKVGKSIRKMYDKWRNKRGKIL